MVVSDREMGAFEQVSNSPMANTSSFAGVLKRGTFFFPFCREGSGPEEGKSFCLASLRGPGEGTASQSLAGLWSKAASMAL